LLATIATATPGGRRRRVRRCGGSRPWAAARDPGRGRGRLGAHGLAGQPAGQAPVSILFPIGASLGLPDLVGQLTYALLVAHDCPPECRTSPGNVPSRSPRASRPSAGIVRPANRPDRGVAVSALGSSTAVSYQRSAGTSGMHWPFSSSAAR